jgi:hypothetical protein
MTDSNVNESIPNEFETWAQVEKFYRDTANGFMKEAEEFKRKASETSSSDPKGARLQNNYNKLAAKYVVQSKSFYALADNAREKNWQDVATTRLAQLEADVYAPPGKGVQDIAT